MKKTYRFSGIRYKILAFLLAAACLFVGAGGLYLAVGGLSDSAIWDQRPYQETWKCRQAVENWALTVGDRFYNNPDYDNWEHLLRDTDYRFILLEESTGDVLASYTEGLDIDVPENLKNNPWLYEYNYTMELGPEESIFEDAYVIDFYRTATREEVWPEDLPSERTEEPNGTVSFQILSLLPQTLNRHPGDTIWQGWVLQYNLQNWFPMAAAAFGCGLVGLLLCLIFLCCQAGHQPGREEIVLCWFDRLPLDLLLLLAFLAGTGVALCFCAAVDMQYNSGLTVGELELVVALLAAATMACGEFIVGFFVTLAARIKQGRWWQTSLLWRLGRWVWKLVRKLFAWLGKPLRRVGEIFRGAVYSMGMAPRAALVITAVLGLDVILGLLMRATNSPGPMLLLVLFYNLLLLAAVIFAVGQMKQLQSTAKKLAAGDLDYQLDTSKLYYDFREHGNALNDIAEGMNKAVEQRMKSERLKTELITNVSHDIKTPLTSIVNYVDLLQKPHTEQEGAQYLEVLDRQAKRLKKLTENLVEASKASTGNLPVELAPTSVLELLNQAVEEYRDRLEAGKLEIVMSLRGDLTVLADGKHMWRILDNLLNNVVKYALAGTRVYVTAEKRGNRVVIAVKNISRDPLNVNADELMERFVRGDSSRSTEGSGLGLNIARSLTSLQNGQFDLTVDGDLFKAEISLPAV